MRLWLLKFRADAKRGGSNGLLLGDDYLVTLESFELEWCECKMHVLVLTS